MIPLALAAPALAGEPLPKSGSAELAACAVCRSLTVVDMGPAGANSSAERISIVKTGNGSKLLEDPESGPIEWIGGTGKY